MKKDSKKTINLFSRYIAILIFGAGNLYLIYKIFTPLTVHTTNLFLKIFTQTTLVGNTIHLNQSIIEIAPPCVVGSAFYLLLVLFFSVADVKPKTRTYAILTALSVFFALNIIRILILTPLIATTYFETIHWMFWHVISTLFVAGTYIVTVKTYKIKSIPFYSDIKYLKSLASPKPKYRRKKK